MILKNQSGNSQIPINFTDYMKKHYEENSVRLNDTTQLISGTDKDFIRNMNVWGERLYPHGNFSIAAKAMYEYSMNYNINKIYCSSNTTNKHWTNISLSGTATNDIGCGTGMINKIYFDPNYDGISNNRIYAASNYGGLWRWENHNGQYAWVNLNTDLQLPFTNVSDIAVSKTYSNNIYIATGLGDIGFTSTFSNPNWGNVNPINTIGIYRSLDDGVTWNSINTGLMNSLQYGGVINRIASNPNNSNQLFAATTDGLYVTYNANSINPSSPTSWTKILSPSLINSLEIKGLEFKPSDPNVIYVSGKDIYKSIDNGVNWNSITGPLTGLDLGNLNSDFSILKINIAVSPANSDKLYAYIIGSSNLFSSGRHAYIFVFNGTNWQQLDYRKNFTPITGGYQLNVSENIDISMMSICVSPINENAIYYGHTTIRGTSNGTNFNQNSGYNIIGLHADIRTLAFEPNTPLAPKLFAGTDGGVSFCSSAPTSINSWLNLNNGLANGLTLTFDQSHKDNNVVLLGMQDLGENIRLSNGSNYDWIHIRTGDGYGANLLIEEPEELFYSSDYNSDLYTYKTKIGLSLGQRKGINEYTYYRPYDPIGSTYLGGLTKTFHTFIHPLSGKMLVGFSELWERKENLIGTSTTRNSLWTQQSDLYKSGINISTPSGYDWWQRQITEFGISKTDENRIYVVTGGVDYGDGTGVQPRFFISTTGGNNGNNNINKFSEVTNLPTTSLSGWGITTPVITGLAISPTDENVVWLTFTGYDPSIKVYKGVYNQSTGFFSWINQDPNQNLANLPVNAIVYQEGTNDRVYIGTDAGVFYKDNSMNCWDRYGDIPNVRVTELKINPCSNKLVASTYGRGIFETDMLPNNEIVEGFININSNVIWTNDKVIEVNVKVKSGNTLTINSNVYMAANTMIVVEPNAKLIIDHAKITNECGALWKGIFIGGNINQNQFPSSAPLHQGYVKITNSIIENSKEATSLWDGSNYNSSGGVLQVENSTFHNNRRSVAFMSYHNHLPNSNISTANKSYFLNTDFIVDDNCIGKKQGFYSHVSLWDVEGINFSNCHFSNIQSNKSFALNSNSGIISLDAGFRIVSTCNVTPQIGFPCPTGNLNSSSFSGFNYGLSAAGAGSNLNTFSSIAGIYNENTFSVKIKNIHFPSLLLNEFTIGNNSNNGNPNNGTQFGIKMMSSSGYKIEENKFIPAINSLTNLKIGISLNGSGVANNVIYKNKFLGNLYGGISATGINKNGNIEGLQFLCNEMSNTINKYNFFVGEDVSFPSLFDGICISQGSPLPGFSDGNCYSQLSGTLDFVNRVDPITVYYNNSNETCQEPIFLSGNISKNSLTNVNTCPSLIYNNSNLLTNSDLGNLITSYSSLKNAYISALYNYNQLIDGGNTSLLVSQVEMTWPQEVWDIRADLLLQSPNLSTDVLKEVSINSNIPQAIALEIYLANISSTRSREFIDFLKFGSPNPMPSILTDIIETNWENSSSKDILESSIASIGNAMSQKLNYLINNALSDSAFYDDTLLNYFNQRLDLEDWYSKACLLYSQGQNENLFYCLDSISNLFKLSDFQLLELNNLKNYYLFRVTISSQGRTLANLSSDELESLRNIKSTSYGRASEFAANILCFFYGECDELEFNPGVNRNKSNLENINITNIFSPNLVVNPNPSNEFAFISWRNIPKEKDAKLLVFDAQGKVVNSYEIHSEFGQTSFASINASAGLYYVKIVCQKKIIASSKFTITH